MDVPSSHNLNTVYIGWRGAMKVHQERTTLKRETAQCVRCPNDLPFALMMHIPDAHVWVCRACVWDMLEVERKARVLIRERAKKEVLVALDTMLAKVWPQHWGDNAKA